MDEYFGNNLMIDLPENLTGKFWKKNLHCPNLCKQLVNQLIRERETKVRGI